jgi:hypothetical protein
MFHAFSSTKSEKKEGGTGSAWVGGGGGWYRWERSVGGKRGRRVNMVQIMYTYLQVYVNAK